MTRAEALTELYDVINVSSANSPFSEARLIGYLAEGQDKFCEETGFFRDYASHTLTLETDTAVYAIPDRVIQVLDIWDGTRRLGKFMEKERGQRELDWDPSESVPRTGLPYAWQSDRSTGFVSFDAVPTAAENGKELQLAVWRYSTFDLADNDIDGEDTVAPFELATRFQRSCIEWAAYKAFNHHDMETQDPVKAKDHLKAFNDYVFDGRRAMRRLSGLESRVGIDQAYRT